MSLPSSVLILMSLARAGSIVSHCLSRRSLPGASIVGDEVGSVVVSRRVGLGAVDDEQPGCRELVVQLAAVDASVHHVDEELDDVTTVAGVVSDELGNVHWLALFANSSDVLVMMIGGVRGGVKGGD